jgi:hypothetical protein
MGAMKIKDFAQKMEKMMRPGLFVGLGGLGGFS